MVSLPSTRKEQLTNTMITSINTLYLYLFSLIGDHPTVTSMANYNHTATRTICWCYSILVSLSAPCKHMNSHGTIRFFLTGLQLFQFCSNYQFYCLINSLIICFVKDLGHQFPPSLLSVGWWYTRRSLDPGNRSDHLLHTTCQITHRSPCINNH